MFAPQIQMIMDHPICKESHYLITFSAMGSFDKFS